MSADTARKAETMTRLKLEDGTSWPRPALTTDDEYGIAHKLRYSTPEKITRSDLLQAASYIEAYEYLVIETTQRQRNDIVAGIRKALRAGGSGVE